MSISHRFYPLPSPTHPSLSSAFSFFPSTSVSPIVLCSLSPVAALSTMPNSGSAMRSRRGHKTLASTGRAPRQRPPPCLPHRRWPSLGWPLELCLGDSPILPSSPASRTPPRWQPSPRLVTALSNSASAPLLQSSSAPRRIWVVTSCVTTCPPPRRARRGRIRWRTYAVVEEARRLREARRSQRHKLTGAGGGWWKKDNGAADLPCACRSTSSMASGYSAVDEARRAVVWASFPGGHAGAHVALTWWPTLSSSFLSGSCRCLSSSSSPFLLPAQSQ